MNLEQLKQDISVEFPSFKLVSKADSRFMKTIDIGLRIITFNQMKEFMTSFVTTIGTTIYTSTEWETQPTTSKISILRHERVHMQQARRLGSVWYGILYLLVWFPAVFAVYRTKFEQEAYEESMRSDVESYGVEVLDDEKYRGNMIRHFTSAEYFWMCPFRGRVERWYDEAASQIRAAHELRR